MAKKATKGKKTGKTPDELVHKHILDKEDIISEEDFKNMHVGEDVKGDSIELKIKKNRPKDEDKDPSIETPWDIISE